MPEPSSSSTAISRDILHRTFEIFGASEDATEFRGFLRDVLEHADSETLSLNTQRTDAKQHTFSIIRSVVSSNADWMSDLKDTDAKLCIRVLDLVIISARDSGEAFGKELAMVASLCARTQSLPPSPYDCSRLEIGEQIGSGAYGDVYKAYLGQRVVAVKKLLRSSGHSNLIEDFVHEVIHWRYLDHSNINPLIGADLMTLRMISPWRPNGNLSGFLQSSPDINWLQLLISIASGVRYMHSLEIAHGDLKCVNILLTDDHQACLTDFGIVRPTTGFTYRRQLARQSHGGTTHMAAPELLDPELFHLEHAYCTKESDIYAFAMVIFEMMEGNVPWIGRNFGNIIWQVTSGERPKLTIPTPTGRYSADVHDLMMQCWSQELQCRPTIDDVLDRLERARASH